MVDIRKDVFSSVSVYYDNDVIVQNDEDVVTTPSDNHSWHREGGLPAWVEDVSYGHYVHDKRHRLNGPASFRFIRDIRNWFIYDRHIKSHEYFEWLDEVGIDINNISDNDMILIALRWNQ